MECNGVINLQKQIKIKKATSSEGTIKSFRDWLMSEWSKDTMIKGTNKKLSGTMRLAAEARLKRHNYKIYNSLKIHEDIVIDEVNINYKEEFEKKG